MIKCIAALSLLFFILSVFVPVEPARASILQEDRPKVGLVLSGGGARGFAHVGAISIIREAGIPIDYISGSSMGSVIGALYAIGYTPEQLEDLIKTINWDGTMSDSGPRRYRPLEEKRWDGKHMFSLPIKGLSVVLPSGLLNGQHISETLSRLTWPVHGITDFNDFPIPFACVATDLETGLPHVMRSGYLSDALRASIALPTLFTPKVINGQTLIDGGIVMNVPALLARDMGADIIITVDATSALSSAEDLGNIVDIMNQTVRFQMIKSNTEQREQSDVIIEPDVHNHSILDFDNPGLLIEKGRQAARVHWDDLVKIADSLARFRFPSHNTSPVTNNSVFITDIEFKGLSSVSHRLASDQIGIEPGSWVTSEEIELGISRLYGLSFFETVIYNIDRAQPDNTLIVNVDERDVDAFRFGFKYENRKGASLYFNTTYRNLLSPASTLRISLGLGREPFIDGQFFNYIGNTDKFGFRSQLNYRQHNIDLYNEGQRIFNTKVNTFALNLLLYPAVSTKFIAGAGFREEAYSLSGSIGIGQFPFDWSNIHIPYLLFETDTLDDILFPTRGYSLTLQSDLAMIPFAGSINYTRHYLNWEGYLPIHRHGSVVTRLNLGYSTYENLPLHLRFFLGGYPDLLGYYPQEFSGNQAKFLQVGYQHQFEPGITVHAAANMGSTNFSWDTSPLSHGYQTGAGLTIRTDTRLGPLGVTFSGSPRHSLLLELNAGFRF
ncbi:MAG: patatin-like phospholipase family protein [Balneolales bacterium]